MKWNEHVGHRPVAPGVLRAIYASDQEMYPAAFPLERLEAWVSAAPELSIEFVAESEPLGVVVALPVRGDSWDSLLSGALKETDMEASRDFGQAGDGRQGQVGIHIFHLEKYDPPQRSVRFRGFGNYAVGAVLDAARAKGYKVLGSSALTATDDGERAFERLGYRPTGYEEAWVDGEAPRCGTEDPSADISGDGRQVSRARMMRRDEAPARDV